MHAIRNSTQSISHGEENLLQHIAVLSKDGSSQVGEFSGSKTTSRIQVFAVLILCRISWISFIFKAALLVISTAVP